MDHVVGGPTVYNKGKSFRVVLGGRGAIAEAGVNFSIVDGLLCSEKLDEFLEVVWSRGGVFLIQLGWRGEWVVGRVALLVVVG